MLSTISGACVRSVSRIACAQKSSSVGAVRRGECRKMECFFGSLHFIAKFYYLCTAFGSGAQQCGKDADAENVSGCSAVRLARQLRELEVPGSNPGTPTKITSDYQVLVSRTRTFFCVPKKMHQKNAPKVVYIPSLMCFHCK